MNLTEAHEYLDLLIDKSDQPYFLFNEKNMFLNLAITEFLNKSYRALGANETFNPAWGARITVTEDSGGQTVTGNSTRLDDYYHITSARLNGVPCKIISDDKGMELITSDNPFKEITPDHPVCWMTRQTLGPTIFFHNGNDIDFINADDGFNLRYLKHLTIDDWDDIPDPYQHEILAITTRKLAANIESSNYAVQNNESQQ